ncbi:MAG TPA: M14 family zinc carboxypeptidase, partial [Gemmatimonadales bacterium]|nr:M14 family zinc carboxypeptidase [Gemmatimonadales bacterium]
MRIFLLLIAAPLAAQAPLTVKVAPGSPAYDFYDHGPYRPAVPRPDSLLGHAIGTRHTMYHQQQAVFDAMAAAAPDRVRFESTGNSAEGKPMRLLVISSPANLARLGAIRDDIAALADPRRSDRGSAEELIGRTPAVAMLSHSIHGNEPAGFEASMITAYTLLASESPRVRTLLDSLVIVINPSQNPDGHERFAAWSNSVAMAQSEPAALEQSEPWSIQGRFNRHRFDMNRDLLAFSQPATASAVLRWRPQLFVDLHSTTPQYFFPPAAAPVNANVPASTVDWFERFGQGNAAAFDRYGWQYYVRDVFDLYYPGYWDSWPSLLGAIGMTFETDGGPELALRKSDGTVTTFREGIAHHVVASFATLETLAHNRTLRLGDYREFFASAMRQPSSRSFRRVVIEPGSDPARTREVIDLLRFQGIEVRQATAAFTLGSARSYLGGGAARRSFNPGAYIIDLAQPQGRLATAILEPSASLDSAFARRQLDRFERNRRRGSNSPREGYEFYDVTAWALPLSHGLAAWWTDEVISVASREPIDRAPMGDVAASAEPARSGYLIRPGTRASQALVLALLREGYNLGVTTEPIRAANDTWEPGTVVIRSVRNPGTLHERINHLARENGAVAVPVNSARADSGRSGIGSGAVRVVNAPKILVAAGDGVSQTAFGDVWQYLERELHQPFVAVETRRLASMNLDEYNVLILPQGGYSAALGKSGMNRIRDWVRGGGAVIAFGGAVDVLAEEEMSLRDPAEVPKQDDIEPADTALSSGAEPASFTSPSARGNTRPEYVPGAIARASLDPGHWLRWGYQGNQLAVMIPGDFLRPSKGGENVVMFEPGAPVLAGFTWPGNTQKFLDGSAWATVERAGRGTVVSFAENPLFRGYWRGTA